MSAPVGVKRFQIIHDYGVDVAYGGSGGVSRCPSGTRTAMLARVRKGAEGWIALGVVGEGPALYPAVIEADITTEAFFNRIGRSRTLNIGCSGRAVNLLVV